MLVSNSAVALAENKWQAIAVDMAGSNLHVHLGLATPAKGLWLGANYRSGNTCYTASNG